MKSIKISSSCIYQCAGVVEAAARLMINCADKLRQFVVTSTVQVKFDSGKELEYFLAET